MREYQVGSIKAIIAVFKVLGKEVLRIVTDPFGEQLSELMDPSESENGGNLEGNQSGYTCQMALDIGGKFSALCVYVCVY